VPRRNPTQGQAELIAAEVAIPLNVVY